MNNEKKIELVRRTRVRPYNVFAFNNAVNDYQLSHFCLHRPTTRAIESVAKTHNATQRKSSRILSIKEQKFSRELAHNLQIAILSPLKLFVFLP